MGKPEDKTRNKVTLILRQFDELYYHSNPASSALLPGTPDIEGCCNGKFFAIELKRKDKTKIDIAQNVIRKKIMMSGGIYIIENTKNDCELTRIGLNKLCQN